MKQLSYLLFFIPFLMFTSCSKDEENSEPEFFVKAKIDGKAYNVEGELYALASFTSVGGTNILTISGTNSNATEIITITSTEGLQVGNFAFETNNQNGNIVVGQYVINDISYITAEEPQANNYFKITEVNTQQSKIKGEFVFVGKEMNGDKVKNITEGKFSCKLVSY